MELKKYLTSYKDFPKKGIVFQDVLGILQEPDIFNELIIKMSKVDLIRSAEAIVSIDARGFLFGAAISLKTSKPLIVARKKGKLPGELVTKSYELEYGKNTLCIQKKSVEKYKSFVIVDDLIATGGTVKCVYEILKTLGKDVTGLAVVIELKELQGRLKVPFRIEPQLIL